MGTGLMPGTVMVDDGVMETGVMMGFSHICLALGHMVMI